MTFTTPSRFNSRYDITEAFGQRLQLNLVAAGTQVLPVFNLSLHCLMAMSTLHGTQALYSDRLAFPNSFYNFKFLILFFFVVSARRRFFFGHNLKSFKMFRDANKK